MSTNDNGNNKELEEEKSLGDDLLGEHTSPEEKKANEVDDIFSEDEDDKKETEENKIETHEGSHRPEHSFDMVDPVSKVMKKEDYKDQHVALPGIYPSDYAEGLSLSKAWRKKLTGDEEEWARILDEGIGSATFDEALVTCFEKGEWTTQMEHDAKDLNPTFYDIGRSKNKSLSGYRASIRTTIAMGGGAPYTVRLWHTGISVTITPPSELSIIELQTKIENMSEDVGRSTFGSLNSNSTVFIDKLLTEFALEHVIVSSMQTDGDIDITANDIMLNDLRPLIFAVMASVYPKGFEYSRACIADAKSCNHTEKGLIDLNKMFYVNKDALSKKHLKHMTSTAKNTMSIKDIEEYQNSLGPLATRKIEIELPEDTAILYLKSPTIAERTASGERWISFLEKGVMATLGKKYDDTQRKMLIFKRAISTNARQYAHYVTKIRYKESGDVISDVADIEDALNTLSTVDSARAKFTTEIVKYIDDSMVAVVAIPVYDCPSCELPQNYTNHEGERLEIVGSRNLIPIDVNAVFIKVVYGRTLLAQMR